MKIKMEFCISGQCRLKFQMSYPLGTPLELKGSISDFIDGEIQNVPQDYDLANRHDYQTMVLSGELVALEKISKPDCRKSRKVRLQIHDYYMIIIFFFHHINELDPAVWNAFNNICCNFSVTIAPKVM